MAAINKLSPTGLQRGYMDLIIKGERKEVIFEPGKRYADGGNLWLQLKSKKSGSWLFQYKRPGEKYDRQMGLGAYPAVSLAEARRRAAAARAQLSGGKDPIEAKRQSAKAIAVEERAAEIEASATAARIVTFRQAAADFIKRKEAGWRNAKHADQWANTLATYAYPVIGGLAVSDIETAHVVKILEPIWTKKPETASRVRGRIEKVLSAARVFGHRSGDNPAAWKGHLEEILAKPSKVRRQRHQPSMPYGEAPAFFDTLASKKGITFRALEVLILTAARTNEIIGMSDAELDLDKKLWTIPGARMKNGQDHEVPLCDRVVEILAALPREGGNPYLFIGQQSGRHLCNMAMLKAMKGLAPSYVPHGFRSTFNVWASEKTDADPFVIEASLAHTIRNKSMAAYKRTTMLEKRRKLMDQWQAFLYRDYHGKENSGARRGGRGALLSDTCALG
ncbi:integrase arm-type DNA-binding domain-containing protein [Bradyrhizobium sp. 4]|uniref:tyrosine-type recombinase/integrase n=1 Tax=unclassified Bradyrhizobium TaxID=2631580 RepID=UPI001FFB2965|nr:MULTISPECIES: site-specific integrase [unclassified Bradyrhizobium]MCK1403601.1 integrase arm-type DNA-binding domain-containing protein [Bradyrhizobium sp. 39]MCK1746796.1 integrase arm-type DNA-binding domain-containing protein [Bradyrhizobium sp. 135]UPJ35706.1 integrase arm-type DNA-binding domain-containing protein [Bradyrhizobium sp. 4]